MTLGNQVYPTERTVSPNELSSILYAHGLNVNELTPLAEGWDFFVYKLNCTHILRVPKRRQGAVLARREIAFLNALRPLITVTIPHYDIVIEAEETNGLLLGYPFLEGDPLQVPVLIKDFRPLAMPLAELLSAVHSLPETTPVQIDSYTNLMSLRDKAYEASTFLSTRMDAQQRREIISKLDTHITLNGARVPIHNDLRPDHILRSSNEIAVIDWTDIAWGYPWEDLLYLWVCYGDGVVRAIAEHYPEWDPSWENNIKNVGTWKALLELQYAIETSDMIKAAFVEQFISRIANGRDDSDQKGLT